MLLQMAFFNPFLKLSNIPVCVYVYHIFFTHSCVNGHLGCFHVLAIVNSDAVNVVVLVLYFSEVWFFPDACPGVGLLDHMVDLLLVF